jgi:hypothetical protein
MTSARNRSEQDAGLRNPLIILEAPFLDGTPDGRDAGPVLTTGSMKEVCADEIFLPFEVCFRGA